MRWTERGLKWTVGLAMGVALPVLGALWAVAGEAAIFASRKLRPHRSHGRQGQYVERLSDLCVAYWVAWATYG